MKQLSSKQLGNIAEEKSIKFIYNHPAKYGIVKGKGYNSVEPDGKASNRVCRLHQDGGLYVNDLFWVEYGEPDAKGKRKKAGWDLQTLPCGKPVSNLDMFALPADVKLGYHPMYLIQVKYNWNLSTKKNLEYIQVLADFEVPPFIRKEVHVWNGDAKIPVILDLTNVPNDNNF